MQLLNYTNRDLLFVPVEGLTAMFNGKFRTDNLDPSTGILLLRESKSLSCRVMRQYGTPCFGVPTLQEIVTGADPLPEGDDLLIVSRQYAMAVQKMGWDTSRLRLVTGAVYNAISPQPVACTALTKFYPDCPSVEGIGLDINL
jgi:hypothetical protein